MLLRHKRVIVEDVVSVDNLVQLEVAEATRKSRISAKTSFWRRERLV